MGIFGEAIIYDNVEWEFRPKAHSRAAKNFGLFVHQASGKCIPDLGMCVYVYGRFWSVIRHGILAPTHFSQELALDGF
jgi:hypothetical protein